MKNEPARAVTIAAALVVPVLLVPAFLVPVAASADGGMTVQLPDISSLPEAEAKALIAQLAQANVITANCPDYAITTGEWSLITGTGDRLAARLGLNAVSYDRDYYAPAFQLMENPGACNEYGPMAEPLIQRLEAMGGDTAPIEQSQ